MLHTFNSAILWPPILDWGQCSEDFGAVLKQSLAVLMAKSWWPLVETLPTPHIHNTSCMQQAIDLALGESSFRRLLLKLLSPRALGKLYAVNDHETLFWLWNEGFNGLNWYLYPTQISFLVVCWIYLVHLYVCMWHGFQSITWVCFRISILKYICMFPMPLLRSLCILGLKITFGVFLTFVCIDLYYIVSRA